MRVLSIFLALISCVSCLPREAASGNPQPARPAYASPGQPPAPTYAPSYAPNSAPQPARNPAASTPGDPYASARQACLDQTNAYRARTGAAPVVARPEMSPCTDQDARGDATRGTVHGESGKCGMMAQNECPSWPGTAAGIVSECLRSMFDEGPGEPYSAHGHYINMTSRDYHGLACGFYENNGKVWLVQNYFY